jgi:hypothetical protein
MTKSATREAADKVTFTQTEVTSAVALKAPIASPVFTGNVGVGTNPSNAKLEVAASSGEVFRADAAGGSYRIVANQDGVLMNGNVGIGVVPEAHHNSHSALQVGGNGVWTSYKTQGASGEMDFQHNAYYSQAHGGDRYISTDEATKYRQGGGAHQWYTAGSGSADAAISWTTAMAINNTGNVAINATPNAYEKLKISASMTENALAITNHSYYYPWAIRILNSDTVNRAGQEINFRRGAADVGSIQTSTSSTSYNTSSDYRLKENVTPMSGATAHTKLLKPCNFDWIIGGNVNGFIAHELAEVVPEAVTGTKDAMKDEEYEVTPAVLDDEGNETTAAVMGTRSVPDMQGIDQAKLVPLLTATIQELIARIEALEGE